MFQVEFQKECQIGCQSILLEEMPERMSEQNVRKDARIDFLKIHAIYSSR